MTKLSRWPWLVGPLALGALLAWTPTDDGPTFCPYALITGHACPGCGMTRALAYLVRGDFDRAISYHPLSAVLVLAALVGMVWLAGKRRWSWPTPSLRTVNLALTTSGVLALAVWLTRMATGTLPPV